MPEQQNYERIPQAGLRLNRARGLCLAEIDRLTARGVMDPKLLYEPPFTDFDAMVSKALFERADAASIIPDAASGRTGHCDLTHFTYEALEKNWGQIPT